MNNLKERRTELGLTQMQVSSWLKSVDERYDVGMVSRLECGVCLPTPPVLDALCEVLQAPSDALYGREVIESINLADEKEALPAGLPAYLQRVVCWIPEGRDKAVSRGFLRAATGMSDRQVRKCIEKARGLGVLICNDGSGCGYYIADADDLDDIERNYWQERSRALSILYRLKAYRKILISAGRRVS